MADNRVVTELIIDARGAAAGSAEFQRRMEAAQAAVDRMIEREQRLNQATVQTGAVLEAGAASVSRRARQWDALAASLDPVVAAEQKAAKAIRDATQIADAGTRLLGRSQAEAAAMVAEVTKRETAKVEAIRKGVAANDQLTRSTGLARDELVNLSRQAQDVVVSLQGGQGLFTVLLQQGSQIADVFAASKTGTVGGFFKQMADSAAAAITPMRLAGGAAVAAAGLATYAVWQWTDSQLALNKALTGTGLSAGVTRNQIGQMADDVSRLASTSIAAARDSLAAFANTGKISAGLLPSLAGISRPLGAQLGLDAASANKLLAESFADPLEGYRKITAAVGGFNIQIDDQIKKLIEQGRRQDAQNLLLQETQRRVAPLTETTSELSRAWQRATDGLSNFIMKVGELTSGPLARFMNTSMDVLNGIGRGTATVSNWRQSQVADSRPARLLAGVDIEQRALDAANRSMSEIVAYRNDLLARPFQFGRDPQSVVRYNQELENTNKRLEEQARVVAQLEQSRQNGAARPSATAAREREAAARGTARIDQTFADAASRATASTEAQARAEASLREELDRRVRSQNQATDAARQLGAVDAQGLRDLNAKINQYNQMTDVIRQMTQDRTRDPGLAQNEQWRAQLEEMLKTQGVLRATIEGSLRNGGRGMFNPAEQFIGSAQQVEAQFRRQIDLTREQTAADIQQTQARTQSQRIAATQNAERISMSREGIQAGDEAARAARLQGAAQRIVAQDVQALTDAQRERKIATEASVRSIESETAALGGSIGQQEAARARVQMTNEARREYIRLFGMNAQVPQAELDAIDELAKRLGRARQQAAELKALSDIRFERDTMFMSDTDRRVAQMGRSLHGDQWRSFMDSGTASQIRFNDQLKLTGELMSGFGQSMIQDLRNGASLWDALGNAAAKMGDRLLSMAMDQAIKQLLGMLSGPLGGMFGGGSGYTAGAGGYMGAGPFMPNALGGVYSSPSLSAFSNGIYNTPQMFAFAQGAGVFAEAGPEAIMPLKRAGDGSLGVRALMPRMQAPASAGRPVSVTVNNNHSGAEVRESHDEQGNVRIDIMKAVGGTLADQVTKGRGQLGRAIGARFGIGQAGYKG